MNNSSSGLEGIRGKLLGVIHMGYPSYRVFEDWIALMFFAFQRDDPHYLEIVHSYRNSGKIGEREIDLFSEALGELLRYLRATNTEAFSRLFTEFAADHYHGQYFTPAHIADFMARLTMPCQAVPEKPFLVNDLACGAGACLVATIKAQTNEVNDRAFFVGQDIDLNCCRMTALNLMFFNVNGLVIWGNTLTGEIRGAWETSRDLVMGGSLRPASDATLTAWRNKQSYRKEQS